MKKAVVIYSGGMDSFTLLNDIIRTSDFDEVHAVSFNYGQRHSKELDYAAAVTNALGIPHQVVEMAALGKQLMGGSSQTDDIAVPEGHYADENMKLTVVPNRNMVMLSLAVAYAVSIGAEAVFYGAHSGDHAIYPDCRKEFIDAMSAVCEIANFQPVRIEAPYCDIAIRGRELELDYGQAWTCYNGREKACGKCGACQERIEAMAKAGINDPMEYEA